MKKIISKMVKIFNKVSLYTLYFLIFVLYLILFEIPIPFVASNIEQTIYEYNKEKFHENNINFSIKSVALGWNYKINRPVVIIKGISYSQGNYLINLSKVAFFPNIKNSIKEKKVFLEKILFEGLNLIVTSSEKHGYKIQLDNNLVVEDNEQSNSPKITKEIYHQESFLEKVQNKDNFKKSKFYQLVLEIKEEISPLRYLDEFMINKSNIIFINKQKRFLALDVDSLSLREDIKDIHIINLKSSLTFDNDTSKLSKLTFNGSINKDNLVKWDLLLEKILLSNVHNYVIKDKKLKDLELEGFEGDIRVSGFYNTITGLENFNSTVDVKQGTLSYKNYISKPMKINNISSSLFYDKKLDHINIKNFNVNFSNNNKLFSKELGLNIPLNKLNAKLKFNFQDNSLVIDKLTLFSGINKVNLSLDYLPYSKLNKGHIKLNADSANLDVRLVKQLWPKHYLVPIKEWIVDNVQKAKVDNTSFKMNLDILKNNIKIKKLEGDVFLSNGKIKYLGDLPVVEAKKVNIKYGLDTTSIKYYDAITGNIKSKQGEVIFYNKHKDKSNTETTMHLNIDVDSNATDALLFIDNNPLDLLKQTGLIPSNISGSIKGKIKLDYLFKEDEVVNKEIKLNLTSGSFIGILPNINTTKTNLNLLVNDSGLNINGTAYVLDEKIDTGIQINWENDSNIIQTYLVDIKNFPVEKIYDLNLIDNEILDRVKGSIDGKFNYYKDSKIEKLSFYNDLTNALFYFDVFNYRNKVGEKLSIEGTSIFKDGKLQEIKNLKIKAPDISTSIGIKLGNNKSKDIYFNNFYIKNKANFKGSINFSENMKSFNLQGSFLDLYPIFNYFKGNNNVDDNPEEDISASTKEVSKKKRGIILRKDFKQEEVKEMENLSLPEEDNFDNINTDDTSLSEKVGNISLKLNFDKIVNLDESVKNLSFNLLWKDNTLKVLSFSAKMDSSRESSYVLYDERENNLGFRIQNIGNLLRLLDFPSQIKDGDLEGKVKMEKVLSKIDKSKFYIKTDGKFVVNNFSAGFTFATAYGSFRGKDLYFRVDQLELQGNLMGGSMKGYVNIKDREIDIYGKLIPIWSASNLLTNAPILKSLFNNIPIAKNLIQINARIKGDFDDIKYSIFSKDLQKGDIINELNYSKLGEDINNPKTINKKNTSTKVKETKNDEFSSEEDKIEYLKED